MLVPLSQESIFRVSNSYVEAGNQSKVILEFDMIHVFDDIESTQNYIRQNLNEFPSLVVVESQSSGKGRFSRDWHSVGENVLMSCSWLYDIVPPQLSGLGLALIVELAELLREDYSIPATIKWPNDLLIGGKKAAGILIDVESGSCCKVYIGLGLNVQQLADSDIDQPWADMASYGAANVDRNMLIGRLFSRWYVLLLNYPEMGFSAYQDRWMKLSEHYGKEVALFNDGKKVQQGVMQGVDEQGFLLIRSGQKVVQITDAEYSLKVLF